MTEHSLTKALSGTKKQRNEVIERAHARYSEWLASIARRDIPEDRRRSASQEDAVQDSLIALGNELERQEQLLNEIELSTTGRIPTDSQIRARLRNLLRSSQHLSELQNMLRENGIATSPELWAPDQDSQLPDHAQVADSIIGLAELDNIARNCLLGFIRDRCEFASGDDVKRWLYQVVRNKAKDIFSSNLRHRGMSVLKQSADADPDMTSPSRVKQQSITEVPDVIIGRTELIQSMSTLDTAVQAELGGLGSVDRNIVESWLKWQPFRRIAQEHGLRDREIRVITFEFKMINTLQDVLIFRQPVVEQATSEIRSQEPEITQRRQARKLREALEAFACFYFEGIATRLFADLRDAP